MGWKLARQRGAFAHAESDRALRRSLETALLEGDDTEAARLRELLRLRRLLRKMAPVYSELRREVYWRGTMEALAAAAESKMPATERLAKSVRRPRWFNNLDDEQRQEVRAKRRDRKARRRAKAQ